MRKLSILRLLCGGVLALSVTGCGFFGGDEGLFRDRAEDYKQAPELPVIEVPAGKDTEALREIYVIPKVQEKLLLEGEFEVPRPVPLVAGAGADVVRIQRLGDDSWALIGVPPGQVWPQVRSFLAASNMQVARVDARAGIIETAWLSLAGQELPSRFRFRMDQGVQRGTSELHVLQMSRGAGEEWPAQSSDAEQAADMLRTVSQFLADSAETAPVSMVAEQGISATGKITLREDNTGETYIHLQLPYDRAWASLGKALGDASFEVVDRDRSEGIYYARFLGPEDDEDASMFDWLWGDDDPAEQEMFLVSMQAGSPGVVHITLTPESDEVVLTKRDRQALLALIKGKID
ncbi:MAG: outer membrane protein assembly factor BamC [Halioglobus sp.]|nr:outer membrane protein assembly factor BamC [Halioglobus sp.]